MSHVPLVNESCPTCKWVTLDFGDMSYIGASYVALVHESLACHIFEAHLGCGSCHTHEQVMSHTWTGRVTHMNESCPLHFVRHDSFACATTLEHIVCATRLKYMCDMTHSFVCATRLTHSNMRHASPVRATWLIRKCTMTHPYVQHECVWHV